MVHEDDTYSISQKFNYLHLCLAGAALDLVRDIPISYSNYTVMVERLKKCYDNPSLLIQSHMMSILDYPKIKEPSSSAQQELCTHVCTRVAALSSLGQPIEYWDA